MLVDFTPGKDKKDLEPEANSYSQIDANHFIGFLNLYTIEEKKHIQGKKFYNDYVYYSMRRDIMPMKAMEFYTRIRNLGIKVTKGVSGYNVLVKKKEFDYVRR